MSHWCGIELYYTRTFKKVLQRSSKYSLRGSIYASLSAVSSRCHSVELWVSPVLGVRFDDLRQTSRGWRHSLYWSRAYNQSIRSKLFISIHVIHFQQANSRGLHGPPRRAPVPSIVEEMKEGPRSSGLTSVPVATTFLSCDLFQPFREPRSTLPGVGWATLQFHIARHTRCHCGHMHVAVYMA